MAAQNDVYKLFYWQGFTARAEPILLLLEDAGVEYEYITEDAKKKTNKTSSYISHAFPVLEKGGFTVSQTTAIMQYLGAVHGYNGRTPEEEANVLQVALNAADLWVEGYYTRSGVASLGLTSDNGKTFWQGKRGEVWLKLLEKNLQATDGDYFFGANPTYADFCVFNAINVIRFVYGEHFEQEYKHCAVLQNFENTMKNRPKVKAFFERNTLPVLYEGVSAATLPEWN